MSGVFKAYDVRGIYPTEINEDLAYKIGKAYVEFLGANEHNEACFAIFCKKIN